ncbi:MAG: DsbA family protein [Tepidiformaceae bacterium]
MTRSAAMAALLFGTVLLLATACSKIEVTPTPDAGTAPAAGSNALASPFSASPAPGLTAADQTLVKAMQAATADLPLQMSQGNKLGNDNAPLKLIEFEDFQCPYCLRYSITQEPTLISEYVKTGRLQIIYESLPILGQESVNAAEAAQCAADQDKFWPYHNLLFLTQAQAGQSSDEQSNIGRFSGDNLKQMAGTLGLDRAAFDSCYDSGKYDQLINDQYEQAHSFGLNGTPGFVLNGKPLGSGVPPSLDYWRNLFQQSFPGV